MTPAFDVWLHNDTDGTPWMIVSVSFTEEDVIRKTLRLDFDGHSICGGWSPANLNWDDGVRAEDAEVDTGPPDGIYLRGEPLGALAESAATWLGRHWEGASPRRDVRD